MSAGISRMIFENRVSDIWGMGNGEWGMGNGEWGMGNGEWGMGNGEWGMGNGEWGIDCVHSRGSVKCIRFDISRGIFPIPHSPFPFPTPGEILTVRCPLLSFTFSH